MTAHGLDNSSDRAVTAGGDHQIDTLLERLCRHALTDVIDRCFEPEGLCPPGGGCFGGDCFAKGR
jgi:hypothetical protein